MKAQVKAGDGSPDSVAMLHAPNSAEPGVHRVVEGELDATDELPVLDFEDLPAEPD